jgi:hypothetical protein
MVRMLAEAGIDVSGVVTEAPVRETFVALFSVETADVGCAQVFELPASERGNDVIVNVALVGVVAGASEFALDAVG